jgi:ABC-type oligopeptide transport system ATPase subunit
VSTQAEILELLRTLQRRFALTMLFISHDLAVVRDISAELTVLFAGRVVEEGPTHRVLSRPEAPYTTSLIASVPTISGSGHDRH